MIITFAPLPGGIVRKIEDATGEQIVSQKDRPGTICGADIVMTYGTGGLSGDNLPRFPDLKWVFVLSAGVDQLPLEKLSSMGVRTTNVRGIHVVQMAEQAVGEMIYFSRALNVCVNNQRAHVWNRHIPVDELGGKRLLIIGAGHIGCEIAKKARVFGMDVSGLKRSPGPLEFFDEVLGMDRLHEEIPHADYIILTVPLTDETKNLFGGNELALMKKSAVLINMSRGDTVDENALTATLQKHEIKGAALDVFHTEPLPDESPLWDMDNVLLTPHIAGLSPYYMDRAAELFIKSYSLYRAGRPLPNPVDAKLGY